MAYIRKVKTASGATAVQVAHSAYGKFIPIEHIGSAHNPAELQLLQSLAKIKISSQQTSLLDPTPANPSILLRRSVSDVLYDALLEQYQALGFDQLHDDDFANLVIARIVEPTSKLDSLRKIIPLKLP